MTRRVMQRWEALWFERVPPELYAALRAALGGLCLLQLLSLTPVSKYWTLDGLVPLDGDFQTLKAWLLMNGYGTAAGWVLFVLLVVVFGAMCAGLWSRLAVAASFVGLIVQASWNPLPLNAGHRVLTVSLFYLLWADTGAAASIDAWRRAKRGGPQSIWPLQLLRIQIALIYFSSALWKFVEPAWRDGTAVYYSLANNTVQRFPWSVPPSLQGLATMATYSTLLFEFAFAPLVLFRPTRRIALVGGIVLHVGLWAALELGPLSFVMIATYLAFLDPVAFAQRLHASRATTAIADVRKAVSA